MWQSRNQIDMFESEGSKQILAMQQVMRGTDRHIHEYLRSIDIKQSEETQKWLENDNSKKYHDSKQKIRLFTKPAISSIQQTQTSANNAVNKLIQRKLQSLSNPARQPTNAPNSTKHKKCNTTVTSKEITR